MDLTDPGTGGKKNRYQTKLKYMKQNYPPNFEYADFAPMFKAEFFYPTI